MVKHHSARVQTDFSVDLFETTSQSPEGIFLKSEPTKGRNVLNNLKPIWTLTFDCHVNLLLGELPKKQIHKQNKFN